VWSKRFGHGAQAVGYSVLRIARQRSFTGYFQGIVNFGGARYATMAARHLRCQILGYRLAVFSIALGGTNADKDSALRWTQAAMLSSWERSRAPLTSGPAD
jgi:hypothetical protein